MEVYINYAKLERMLADFFQLSQLRIGFWDSAGHNCIVSCDDSCSAFCRNIQQHPALLKACRRCELAGLEKAKQNPNILHHFRCHVGMNEFIFPVVYQQTILGYFMYGQARVVDLHDDQYKRFRIYKDYSLDVNMMDGLYAQLPVVSAASMEAAGRMLANLAKYSHLSGLIKLHSSMLSDQAYEYIYQNSHLPITIDVVSKYLYVSQSTLSHTLSSEKGTTFVKMLNACRVEHVKRCLSDGESIIDAAFQAGFRSGNYMTRVFKQIEGTTPSQYRDRVASDEV